MMEELDVEKHPWSKDNKDFDFDIGFGFDLYLGTKDYY